MGNRYCQEQALLFEEKKLEKALLVGLNTGDDKFDDSMSELKSLAEAADYEVVGIMVQNLAHPVAATYIGSGKVEEICGAKDYQGFEVCIFEDTLSPVQQKNVQAAVGIRVMDRTGLILEIFAKRARTRDLSHIVSQDARVSFASKTEIPSCVLEATKARLHNWLR